MTYIDLINSFWDLATTNPLSTGQVSLYFALLHVCNRSYWTEWFSAPNQVLSVLTGLSRSGILKARNELKQRGLIDFRERGTKATSYKLTMANSVQTDVLIANSKQVSTQDGVQISGTLYKTKDKDNHIPPISPVERFADFWGLYPLDKNKTAAEKAYCDVLFDGIYDEDVLVESAKNYAEYCRITGTDKIYHANNFLKSAAFEDYLPGKYKKPSPVMVKNTFNQFKQNDYDFAEMEQKLLAN